MSAHDHRKIACSCAAKAWLASQSGEQALTSGRYHEPGSEDWDSERSHGHGEAQHPVQSMASIKWFAICITRRFDPDAICTVQSKHNLFYIQADEETVEEATMSEVEIWNGKNRLQTQVGHRSETVPRIHQCALCLPEPFYEERSYGGNATAWCASDSYSACRLLMSARIQWPSGQLIGTGIASTSSLGVCF